MTYKSNSVILSKIQVISLSKTELIRQSYINAIKAVNTNVSKLYLTNMAMQANEIGLMPLTDYTSSNWDENFMEYTNYVNTGVGRFRLKTNYCRFNFNLLDDSSEIFLPELRLTGRKWDNIKHTIRLLYNNTCVYCGSQNNIHIDHLHPLSKGGTNGLDNLVCACSKCNFAKGTKTLSELIAPFNDNNRFIELFSTNKVY